MSSSEPTRFRPASSQPGRVYVRRAASRRWRFVGAALLILAGSFLLGSPVLTSGLSATLSLVLAAGGAVILSAGVLVHRDTRRFRLVLHADHLEIQGVFDKTILRSQIAGYRINGRGLPSLVDHDDRVLLALDRSFDIDQEFDDWFAHLVDLGQRDFVRAVDEAVAAMPGTRTRDERLAHLQKMWRVLPWVGLAFVLVLSWFALYPRPYVPLLIVGVVVPPAAIASYFALRPLIRFQTVPGWLGVDLLCLVGSGALAFRAAFDTSPLEWSRLLLLTGLCTVPFAPLVLRLAPRRRLQSALAAAPFLAGYFYGVLAFGNQLLDGSAPTQTEVRVLEVHGSTNTPRPCGVTVRGLDASGEVRRLEVKCSWLPDLAADQWLRVELLPGAVGVPWWRWAD